MRLLLALVSLIIARQSAVAAEAASKGTYATTPRVNLGYAIYQGTRNSSNGLDTYLGIRFAAPPTGQNRFKAPKPPTKSNGQGSSSIIQANTLPPRCPQSYPAPYQYTSGSGFTSPPLDPNAIAADPLFQALVQGNEDCLFLNVYAPSGKRNLPVLVWIHGGGYGFGDGSQNLAPIINANNNGFIGVSIQYRLGAFGFLSSQDVKNYGALNAGLLDQNLALQWVQKYISKFGGDPGKVTISGNSAGGGSVMLHNMAYGGTLGTSLFINSISTSPYAPPQHKWNAAKPTNDYLAFAQLAGCYNGNPVTAFIDIMSCLASKDTIILQQASAVISGSGIIGTWAFVPVTDGSYVRYLPSQQLESGKLNGKKHLTGHNADEGALFVQPGINTQTDFQDYVKLLFPGFSASDVANVISTFYSPPNPMNPADPLFATLGYTGPTALNQSVFATGQQQRANNLYAEATFVCPSYWIADAFSKNKNGGYKYQYSVVPAMHTTDVTGYFGPIGGTPNMSPEFQKAFMKIWGNFIISSDPSISPAVATGSSTAGSHPSSNWQKFYLPSSPWMINLNQTGGVPGTVPLPPVGAPFPANVMPGLKNDITKANGYTWEGGRGQRCNFWKSLAAKVPQ